MKTFKSYIKEEVFTLVNMDDASVKVAMKLAKKAGLKPKISKGKLGTNLKVDGPLKKVMKFANSLPNEAKVNEKGKGLWYNINQKRKRGEKMRKKGDKGAPTQAAMDRAKGESVNEGEGKYKGEKWEDGYKRRVVKVTDPKKKDQGFKWRIKGKERNEITIKYYKEKPDFKEYTKQMKRVAGHEFGG